MLNVALCMRIWREARNVAWRWWCSLRRCCKTFCFVCLLTSVGQNVCLCTMDFVSAGKNTLLLYVTVCEKVVPRLNKHDDVIEWNFVKIAPPRNEELVAPLGWCGLVNNELHTSFCSAAVLDQNHIKPWCNSQWAKSIGQCCKEATT